MKQILKASTHQSKSIKVAVVVVILIGLVSFFFSLKYAGEKKNTFPILTEDTSIPKPIINANGGYYKEPFALAIEYPINCKVYYTVDGTEPSLESILYTQPILIQDRTNEDNVLSAIPTSPRWKPPIGNVFKGTSIRAICVSSDNKKSKEVIRTFIVRNANYNFPVIALTINMEDFFGYKKGIYVLGKNYEDKKDYIKRKLPLNLNWWEYPSNYLKRGENSERKMYIEFYNENKLAFESYVGVRINGNATRGFSQKSLRVIFNKKYGLEKLDYSLFPDYNVVEFNSFILRNSGNDWDKTMFRDAFMQSLMKNTNVDIQMYRPSIVFINGEYWGIHNIRERFDENYLANKYHLNKDSIAILQLNNEVFYGDKSDKNDFDGIIDFVKNNDLSKTKNYIYIEGKIDITSFMDFIIANVFFCNSDWPNNNVKFWRYTGKPNQLDSNRVFDSRWRWMLYDTDWGFGYTGVESYKMNLLVKALKTGNVGVLFSNLCKNTGFLKEFEARFKYHIYTTFNCYTVFNSINKFEKNLSPEIYEHINRWRAIGSFEQWESNVIDLRVFENKRNVIQREQLNLFINNIRK